MWLVSVFQSVPGNAENSFGCFDGNTLCSLKWFWKSRVRCVRKRKAHLVHFYYPDIPSWESWSETAMAQIFCCEPNVSPSVSLHFFFIWIKNKSHFLVELEWNVRVSCVWERGSVWECICVCACDSFTMCRVAAWGWMKSDVKEPVRSGLPSETLLLLLPPPLPLPPDWRLDRKTLLCMLPGTLSL